MYLKRDTYQEATSFYSRHGLEALLFPACIAAAQTVLLCSFDESALSLPRQQNRNM
jgi:hypothetical protein